MSVPAESVSAPSTRLTSLDQFRGYTMVGMILVNYLGAYKEVAPRIFRHTNDYCSYADTIMPHFFFAVGFAMRLSLGKRLEAGGKMPWGRAVRRILGLALVAIVWYSIGDLSDIIKRFQTKPTGEVLYALFKGHYFQTLMHIAATSLWILPVIATSWKTRLGYTALSALIHFVISWWFNFAWVQTSPGGIDGGPLGFFSWAVPTLCGTIACDVVRSSGTRAATRLTMAGLAVMLFGWALSMGTVLYNVTPEQDAVAVASPPAAPATQRFPLDPKKFPPDPVIPSWERIKSWDGTLVEPPFVPPPDFHHRRLNYWMMSQRTCNLSYTIFSAGLSLVVYAFFLVVCDGMHLRVGLFRTLGTNSLAAYVLHDVAIWIVSPFVPNKTTSVLLVVAGYVAVTLIVYAACRFLEWKKWYLRV